MANNKPPKDETIVDKSSTEIVKEETKISSKQGIKTVSSNEDKIVFNVDGKQYSIAPNCHFIINRLGEFKGRHLVERNPQTDAALYHLVATKMFLTEEA